MDNLDDSENNAKISDSGYSNSCSNSQSRRSQSSKSTRSGSNSSGSSGYGGKPSSSLGQPPEKRSKDAKKKKQQVLEETVVEEVPVEAECKAVEQVIRPESPKEQVDDVVQTSSPVHMQPEKGVVDMDICTTDRNSNNDEIVPCNTANANASIHSLFKLPSYTSNGFSCVISMHDGVVIYTTTSLTTSLGFPSQMWVGRSFIDFVHPRDRSTFASQITSCLASPKVANGTQEKGVSVSTIVCRLRRYRGLSSGFNVTERSVTYLPFLLKLSFRNISDEEGSVIYLVLQANQFGSAFKTSNESITNAIPFMMRHSANGNLEYIDPESVPYLGYLPQEILDKDVLLLYHPEDLDYLRLVYETIVKEGRMSSSKPYRLMAQNGDYVNVETEWSSFVNPWSKKLEFVTGKHHVIAGPINPDVFQPPNLENASNQNAEQKNKLKCFRDDIIRIMNEVLSKPAELAKQHMPKTCQDLATFMERLLEEQPKAEEELRLEIQEADNSFYIKESNTLGSRQQVAIEMVFQERDSVMLGGISPHHEYNDSKSSSDTPLSYNQLNYNENMQRYFDSHQPYSYEDYNTVTGENILDFKDPKATPEPRLSPLAQHSADSGEMKSTSDSNGFAGGSTITSLVVYQPARLTESMLSKHNTEMEKELVKLYRGNRSGCKGDAEKNMMKSMRNKQEHLARCNTAYQPTSVGVPLVEPQPHGLKRACKPSESEAGGNKCQCSSPKQTRCKQSTSAAPMMPLSTLTTTVASRQWPATSTTTSNMNTYLVGFGIPRDLPVIGPVAAVPGVFPLYYSPATGPAAPRGPEMTMPSPSTSNMQITQPTVQCMMYGQAMYGSPVMYSPIAQVQYPLQENLMAQTVQFSNPFNQYMTSSKPSREQKQATLSKLNAPLKPKSGSPWRSKLRGQASDHISADNSNSSTNAMQKTAEMVTTDTPTSSDDKTKGTRLNSGDRTDEESSYSSFYSSFFKTDSGSAEESGGNADKCGQKNRNMNPSDTFFEPQAKKRVVMARRKMEPPWMEQVCVTSELVYKYQVLPKSMDQVLTDDKKKMDNIEQPSLVNEQLGQLYLDLQLEGVASRLTLEEGVTSSGSSVDESTPKTPIKVSRRKREYSKLVLIYEEEMPLPPPGTGHPAPVDPAEPEASTSAS